MSPLLRGLEGDTTSFSVTFQGDTDELLVNQTDETTDDGFAKEHFGLFVFLISGAVSTILVVAMIMREFYWRKYGVDVCPGVGRPAPPTTQEAQRQVEADRELAETLQRQLFDEEREIERLAKRKERRLWYESYIIPFTTTAKQEDFFYAHEIHHVATGNTSTTETNTPSNERKLHKMASSMSEEDAISSEEEDEPQNDDDLEEEEPILCQQDDEDAHLYMKLPFVNKCGNPRTVDADCAICCCEYEAGDKIVWSGLECQHAFHDQCILPWLAKGKKRCPICRHWFVPGARIDDQKKALEERLRRESSMSEDVLEEAKEEQCNDAQDASTRTASTLAIELGSSDSSSTNGEDDAAEQMEESTTPQQDLATEEATTTPPPEV